MKYLWDFYAQLARIYSFFIPKEYDLYYTLLDVSGEASFNTAREGRAGWITLKKK